jgi:hypothetical protein
MIVTEIKFDDSARLHLVVEIPETESFSTTHMPHMPRILFRMFPYLASQKCNNDHGQSFRREAMATEIPHLFEHLTLEIQKQVRAGVFWDTSIKGETEWNWTIDPRGRFHVTLGYDSEIVALASVRLAERIINALDSREIIAIDIDREMRRLRELARASRRFIAPLRNNHDQEIDDEDIEDEAEIAGPAEPSLDIAAAFARATQ